MYKTLCATAALALVFCLPAAAGLNRLNAVIDHGHMSVDDHCAGTVISVKKQLVLTAAHCVKAIGESATVSKKYYDGFEVVMKVEYMGSVVAKTSDEADGMDLALIHVKGKLPEDSVAAEFAAPDYVIQRGEDVWVVGDPAGLTETLTRGIISNTRRDWGNGPRVQFDAGIWGGNSGGGLYNEEGYLIGVVTEIMGTISTIGFAVPLDPSIRKFMAKYSADNK